ncbi:MAG: DedA family protein [Bacteroidetes bacterium]|nr:MAG: DedA family protein [Bacteroidota bacterium]
MRLLLLALLLMVLVIVPFLIWGDTLNAMFEQEKAVAWMQAYGAYAWLAGMALLIADLFLPIPGTVVMAALGFIYGPWLGGLLSAAGAFLSGLLAYLLTRLMGERGARWLLGDKDFERGRQLFATAGGWVVAISRWLPVFPEVVACMAGISRMPAPTFLLAMACGTLPLGFTFAYIGYTGIQHPALAIALSAGLPPLLWLIAQYYLRKLASKA